MEPTALALPLGGTGARHVKHPQGGSRMALQTGMAMDVQLLTAGAQRVSVSHLRVERGELPPICCHPREAVAGHGEHPAIPDEDDKLVWRRRLTDHGAPTCVRGKPVSSR